MICPHCGFELGSAVKCPHCGHHAGFGGNTAFYRKAEASALSFKDIFSDVFKSHSKTDGERLFMAGTSTTTPNEWEMLREWRKPWLFARVGIAGAALCVLLYFTALALPVTIPAFMVLGAFLTPVTLMLFFWEMNIPRNIPLYEILVMFLAGGTLSIAISFFMFQIIPTDFASFAAFCEEPGKLLALAVFLRKPGKKYVLNGVLIGGAVGTGFAAIESAGYAFFSEDILGSLVGRGVLAPGGHVVWAAMYGGALAYAKGEESLCIRHFQNRAFLRYFAAAVGLHFVWNMGISLMPLPLVGDLTYLLLIALAWLLLMRVLNLGIRQVLTLTDTSVLLPVPLQKEKPRALYVVGVAGEYAGNSIPVSQSVLTFGRDPGQCNIIFPQSIAGVSRKHCTLWFDGKTFWLTDENSSAGTFLDSGERLSPGVPTALRSNASFYLGSRNEMFRISF